MKVLVIVNVKGLIFYFQSVVELVCFVFIRKKDERKKNTINFFLLAMFICLPP